MADQPNSLPPTTVPVLDGNNALTLPWRRALQRVGQSATGGITQLTGDVLAGPGGGVQAASLSLTGVTAGTYVLAGFRVGADGRIIEATNGTIPAQAIGFGFQRESLFSSRGEIGAGMWPSDVSFTSTNPDSYLLCAAGSEPTADAVFSFTDESLTLLGTFTIPAGGRVGTLAWVNDPYIHPAKTRLLIFAPDPPDATLARVNCIVSGEET